MACYRQVQEQLELRETALAGLKEHYERKLMDDMRRRIQSRVS